MIKGLQFEEF